MHCNELSPQIKTHTFKNVMLLNLFSFQLKHKEYPNELDRSTTFILPPKLDIKLRVRDHKVCECYSTMATVQSSP